MTPRTARKLEQPEAFKVVVEGGRFDVIVEEMAARPGYVVMRRWAPGGNGAKGSWKRRALGSMVIRDLRGAVLETTRKAVIEAAMRWYFETTGEMATETPAAVAAPLTIGETFATISSAETGRYPHASPFRTEMQTALRFAGTVWGDATAWSAITSDDWTRLMRRRLGELVARGKTGIRATEITVSRIGTALAWLRAKKLIPANAAIPEPTWREDLLKYWKGLTGQHHDPEPNRPRYTAEQSRALIHAAWDVDPRSGLMLALGAELRLGQVRRAMRSDLDLGMGEFGQFTVRGSGDKLGEVIELTRGQSAACNQALHDDTGYLRQLESEMRIGVRKDYPLFPGGKLFGRKQGHPYVTGDDPDSREPLSRTAISRRWSLIEYLAGVPHIDGRGGYGVRRSGVDAALEENISEHGLKAFGGWSTPDVPRRIYADQRNKAGRADAKKARAAFRGEAE